MLQRIRRSMAAAGLAAILSGVSGLVLAASGGPDAFGYTWLDNNPTVGACAYNFVDIGATGTVIGTGDDSVYSNIPIGFTFNYYGNNHTVVNVSTNGYLALGTTGSSFSNTCPQPVTVNDQQISAFWDDLYVFGPSSLRYQTVGSAPNRTFIVQWENVGFCCTSPPGGDGLTFQIQLHEGTNIVSFMYDDVQTSSRTRGNSATIGIDGPGATNFLATSCNTTDTVSNGHARFFLPPGVQECEAVQAQPRARFAVNKTFTDGNPGEVEVTISCNTGLPLEQTATIDSSGGVEFVVVDYDEGEMDCTVSEPEFPGYSPSYDAGGLCVGCTVDEDEDGCHFDNVSFGAQASCSVTNSPDPVEVEIEKEWVVEGDSLNGVDTDYQITLECDSEIEGGYACGEGCYRIHFSGDIDSDGSFSADVTPDYPDSTCSIEESFSDSAIETENGCGDWNHEFTVSVGNGYACTITNTVFFEGIPTLTQYGLAVLALLMLGVGFVGFRRLT